MWDYIERLCRQYKVPKKVDIPKGSRKLLHGTKCFCGTCGANGTWDEMKNQSAEFGDAVFFNVSEECILCWDCWLK